MRLALSAFIPATREIEIAPDIVYRPIRSWHSAMYAGERMTEVPGSADRSGCMFYDSRGLRVCVIPFTVTHRVYWHRANPDRIVSAYLSYPDAMGYHEGGYFWETNADAEDVVRFSGDNAEAEMEVLISDYLSDITADAIPLASPVRRQRLISRSAVNQ